MLFRSFLGLSDDCGKLDIYSWNIFRFITWVTIITQVIFILTRNSEKNLIKINDKHLKSYIKEEHMNICFDIMFYFIIISVLVGTGHFVLGTFWFVICCEDFNDRNKAKELFNNIDNKEVNEYKIKRN